MAHDPEHEAEDRAVAERSARVPRTRIPSGSEDLTLPHPSEGALLSGNLSVAEVFEDADFQLRYERGALLGQGGMGEVRLHRDRRIGREIALKVIRPGTGGSQPASVVRFLREARVQARLEHPSIVPVYDLGVGPEGEAYFTMKRVRGTTLHDIVELLALGEGSSNTYSRRKLLNAFVQVCFAVDYAHRHGVVHRDLKPANVMLGDFGEVYVLDWGLAKVRQARDLEPSSTESSTEGATGPEPSPTRHGDIIGTPGYLSPEQVRGDELVDGRSDVYALGCLLFELLALEPLFAQESAALKVAMTQTEIDGSPRARAPQRDVPPELDAVCVRATALEPTARFGSARELAEAIEAYLDGARDDEMRKRLAADHAARAEESAEVALCTHVAAEAEEGRRVAMQQVSRALALEPGNEQALGVMVRMLKDPPAEAPVEIGERFEVMADHRARWAMSLARYIYVAWMAPLPFILAAGVLDWTSLALTAVSLLGTFIALQLGSMQERPTPAVQWAAVIGSSLTLLFATRMFGPLMFVPAVLSVTTLSFAITDKPSRRYGWVALCASALVVSLGLEAVGVWPASYRIEEGVLMVLPHMHAFPAYTVPVLAALSVATVVVPAIVYGGMLRTRLNEAEKALLTQSWHLEQLLPRAAEPLADSV